MTWSDTLALFLPELIVGIGALAILSLDFLLKREEVVVGVGLASLLGALVCAFVFWDWPVPLSALSGMYVVDNFAIFFRALGAVAAALVLLSSLHYMRGEMAYRSEFYALVLFATLAIMLMAGSSDLIMIYLALEFLSLTSYVLVGYLRGDAKSGEGALKYLLYGATASAFLLYGMSLLYGATGTTNLKAIAESLSRGGNFATFRWALLPALVMLIAGFGFKISLVPFHQWAPDAYEGAPTPVTAFLSVGPKAAGFAVLIRTLLWALPDFQVDWVAALAGISMVTMTLGNLVAISQRNIKRMLAYSSIAQAGYILIGLVSVGAKPGSAINGLNATLLYLLAYLFSNLGAFLAVIAFYHLSGSDEIRAYAGLARRSPWIAGSLVIFLMSLVGLPPTGGFVGKLAIFSAAIQQREMRFYILAIVGAVNGAISLYYYFNLVRLMFFLPAEDKTVKPIPAPLFVALIIALVMTLGIGLYPEPFFVFASRSAALLLHG